MKCCYIVFSYRNFKYVIIIIRRRRRRIIIIIIIIIMIIILITIIIIIIIMIMIMIMIIILIIMVYCRVSNKVRFFINNIYILDHNKSRKKSYIFIVVFAE